MKRVFLVTACACLILCLCACGKSAPASDQPLPLLPQNDSAEPADTAPLAPSPEESDAFSAPPTVLTPPEYVLYTNIFYNKTGDDYVGQTFTKTGTLARIEDAFNGRTRWYVWGYNDQTKCCDWQWEIVPKDEAALPEIGSLVEATGTFTASESALDGYWITDAEVSVQTPYTAPEADLVLTAMSDTLERVQLLNMQYYPENFEGKTVWAYGRISAPGVLEDPYYDGSWTQHFASDDELPAIGTIVILRGTWHDGVIDEASITVTKDY